MDNHPVFSKYTCRRPFCHPKFQRKPEDLSMIKHTPRRLSIAIPGVPVEHTKPRLLLLFVQRHKKDLEKYKIWRKPFVWKVTAKTIEKFVLS